MKRAITAVLIAVGVLAMTGVALAINTTDALYSGLIRITNNGTASTNVAVPFTANTTVYIADGYMTDSANNTGVSSSSGADIIYMPGFNGTNPWIVHVPSIGANNIQNDTLFMGGATDMEGLLRYFPGAGGMGVENDPSLVPGANFSVSVSGAYDTDAGVDKNIVVKGVELRVFVSPDVSGNITARISELPPLTAFTEEDSNNKLTVTATTATVLDGDRDEDIRLYLDRGAGFYDELDIKWEMFISSNSTSSGFGGPAITNTISDCGGFASTDIGVMFNRTATAQVLLQRGCGVGGQDIFAASTNTSYFMSLTRPAGGDTVTVEIYTDSDRTVLVDTLTQAGFGTTTFQYLFAFVNNNTGAGGQNLDAFFREFKDGSATTVSATGVTSGEHVVNVAANTTDLTITVDGNLEGTTTIDSVVPGSSDNWTFFENTSLIFMETANVSINGTLAASWEWALASTFTDDSGNGNTATPTFRTTSSDADVSAVLVDFLPITEAKAPTFSVNITTAGWITANLTQSGNFTTTTNSTYPLSDVVVDVTDAGSVPVQLFELLLAGVVVLSLSLLISWVMRTNREGSLVFKILVVAAGLGIMTAVSIVDEWILYLFLMISIAIAMGASQRTFNGTGNSGNNMIGFLAMSFMGMTSVNRFLEGRFIQSSDVDLLRNTLAFQPFEVFGLFTIPVPNTDFLLNGIPALMRWDNSYFGGNAQIFQYMLYSVTAVVSFMLFVLVFGAIYQMFSRSR